MTSQQLAEAAAFIAQTWPCFPCLANKRPLTEHGFKDAVRDPDAARRLFQRPGAAMIAVPTGPASGLAVVDLDIKHGGAGLEWQAANMHRLPQTRTHRTMSGGRHLLFEYPAGRHVRNSASRIAPGVDVRGEGGYIIAPPSPGYSIEDASMPAPMPDWLLDLIDPPASPSPPRPALLARARSHGDGSPYGLAALDRECAAIAGAADGGKHDALNKGAYSIGGLVAAGELAEGAAMAALTGALDAIRHRCEDQRAAERTLTQAFEAGKAAPRQAPPPRAVTHTVRYEYGSPPEMPEPPPYDAAPEWADVEPDMATTAGDLPHADRGAHLKRAADAFPTLGLADILALPPPEWLVKDVLTVESNALLFGPYASLKSFLALDLALCIAYGRPWQGREVRQGAVLYIAGEGVRGLGKRIRAWQMHHGLEDVDAPFRLLAAGVSITDPEHVARLIRTGQAAADAEGTPLAVVFIDTLARAMVGADENSAQDMGRAVRGTDELREGLRATTVTVHHSGKDKERGSRGSTALPGGADTVIAVERAESILTITIEKQKDDEEGQPIILMAQKVALDGGDPDGDGPTSLVLVESEGTTPARPSGRLSGDQEQALRVLHDALASHGETGHAGTPGHVPSVPEAWWRERFYDRAKPGAEQDTKKRAFRRAADMLAKQGLVATNRGRVWCT